VTPRRPLRLAFVGVGWIGRHRMQALLGSGLAKALAVADAAPEARAAALELTPGAASAESLEQVLDLGLDLDGVVIATPSALHAAQAELALRRGLHVFCQKPLGRTARETRAVVQAARAADRRLGVDFSYRFTRALQAVRDVLPELGRVYAAELTFHNAYGPDKPWFYDPSLSGGGCVIDLGSHLADAALWLLGFPKVLAVHSRLFSGGELLAADPGRVEDHAVVELELERDCVVQIACSWNLSAGQDAVIGARVYGTAGGVAMSNVAGSFYDFVTERFDRTRRRTLVAPPDEWGGRAIVDWASGVQERPHFDPAAEELERVAEVVDRIYGRSERDRERPRAEATVAVACGSAE